MSTLADSVRTGKVPWTGVTVAFVVALLVSAAAVSNLQRSHTFELKDTSPQRALAPDLPASATYAPIASTHSVPVAGAVDAMKTAAPPAAPAAAAGRKLIRTSSLEMVVQHPAEVAERLAALAQRVGGYLESSDGGGQNATTGILTIRVPSARFDEARAEIHKLGLRVENEKINAQDVTRQYVDQDATLRNLHAEEAQYLTILKQANTVKDMLAVSEELSEVRGQIEQQQAEFNALLQQIDTVALTISLRTEAAEQTFGLNWRPIYQLKLGLRDGLESIADYATAMTSILFYLPAVLLWVGTIGLGTLFGWRAVRWIGRRWFGWQAAVPHQ